MAAAGHGYGMVRAAPGIMFLFITPSGSIITHTYADKNKTQLIAY